MRRDELIDEQLSEPIARDVDAGGPEDVDVPFVTARYTEVEGASDEALADAVRRADEGCPFSTLLKKAGADVRVSRA